MLLICSQALINPKHIQKLEILHEFDVRFHTKVIAKSTEFVMFYWLYKTGIGGRSYSSTTGNFLDFYTYKTKQHLQT